MEWILMPLKRFAEFSGRSRRKEFWIWFLFQVLLHLTFLILIMASVGTAILSGDPTQALAGAGSALVLYVIWGLVSLAFFIPNLAVTIRRLHDSDRSGHWVLLFWAPYLVLFAMGFMGASNGGALESILGLAVLGGGLVLLVFMFFEGTKGPNKYGQDPKGGVDADKVFA